MKAFLLSPEFKVVTLGIVLLMLDSFTNTKKRHIAWTGMVGLTVLLGLSFFPGLPEVAFPRGFYLTDPMAIFFKRYMLLSTILVIALALDYAQVYEEFIPAGRPGAGLGEFFILPIFACAGLMWLVSAADFIMIFVSLELVTMCFYVLVASMRKNLHSLEAGVKYLILGALSTGFLVYGITWITGLTGRTSLDGIRDVLPIVPQGYQVALMFGLGLVLVALGFKVAAVPFQFWVPDVYQGAPTPVTAYLSVASKAAGFVVLMRVIEPFLIVPGLEHKIISVLTILAALTLIYGNLAALPQINLKRLLAYSSIAHAGYLLIGLVAADTQGGAAVLYGTLAYAMMTLGAFSVVIAVGRRGEPNEQISDYAGLGFRYPFLGACMTVFMLSLGGIPLFAGFTGKFFLFSAAIEQGYVWLVVIAALNSVVSIYYYLAVLMQMYMGEGAGAVQGTTDRPYLTATLLFTSVMTILLGLFPQWVLNLATEAFRSLS